MGLLVHNHTTKFTIEDRTLHHLQAVIFTKLRRGERFAFTHATDGQVANGRTSIWIDPDVAIQIGFFSDRVARLNPSWIAALTKAANSSGGLLVLPEPQDPRTSA